MQDIKLPTLEELLETSSATAELKEHILKFSANHRPNDFVTFPHGNPPVKVLRVICGILEKFPELPMESIAVSGHSGCSDFHGEARINNEIRVKFVWDCRWKAEQLGWVDYFGEPDQIKAARTFGYQCFQKLEKEGG